MTDPPSSVAKEVRLGGGRVLKKFDAQRSKYLSNDFENIWQRLYFQEMHFAVNCRCFFY